MMINLKDYIQFDDLSPEEISLVLEGITQRSSIRSKHPNKVMYGESIEAVYKSDSSKVLKILIDASFWKQNKERLKEDFYAATHPLGEKVFSKPVFTSRGEIETYPFRWRDEFQLGRLPDEDPRPEQLFAHHPCLFQFKHPFFKNGLHTNLQIDKYFKKYFLPLIPILKQYEDIHLRYNASGVQQDWGIRVQKKEFESEWMQFGYFFKSEFSDEHFHIEPHREIKRLPNFEMDLYWLQSRSISLAYFWYECLPHSEKEKFLLGCEWYHKAFSANDQTDKIIYIVIMLEIFLPEESNQCKKCGQKVFAINKNFKEYISKTIGKDWKNDFEPALGQLYSLRSKIIHKGFAMSRQFTGLMPKDVKDQTQIQFAFSLGRQFLISWLFKKFEEWKITQSQTSKIALEDSKS